MTSDPNETTPPAQPEQETHTHSLRGSFVAVLLMTVFFLAAWFGVLAIALGRR